MLIPSWAVAAAILILNNGPMHYRWLTQRVVETQLSGLGAHGGTPSQTLRGNIDRHHSEIFERTGRGLYGIRDAVIARYIPQVQLALLMLGDRG